jgi:glutathione peroxidase
MLVALCWRLSIFGRWRPAQRKTLLTTIYDFSALTLKGDKLSLSDFKGQVMLVVNTASKCGFTPQYAGLETLHEKYAKQGLAVLGFPCNQFGQQEPGDAEEIGAFCRTNYGVSFRMFAKVDVNGAGAHPLYRYLTREMRGLFGTSRVKWNFTKFLIDRSGRVVARYSPLKKPAALKAPIDALL